MKNINIIIGRFQPFTLGHLKCAQEAQKESGVPTVLCVIETTKQDARHPFLTTQIADTLDEMCKKEESLAGWVLVKSADIVKNAEILRNNDFNPISWSCGTDRFSDYNRMATRYKNDAGLDEDFRVIEVKRGDDDISATKAREALKSNDQKEYQKLVPKSWWNSFQKLREIIMSLDEEYGLKSLRNYLTESLL